MNNWYVQLLNIYLIKWSMQNHSEFLFWPEDYFSGFDYLELYKESKSLAFLVGVEAESNQSDLEFWQHPSIFQPLLSKTLHLPIWLVWNMTHRHDWRSSQLCLGRGNGLLQGSPSKAQLQPAIWSVFKKVATPAFPSKCYTLEEDHETWTMC